MFLSLLPRRCKACWDGTSEPHDLGGRRYWQVTNQIPSCWTISDSRSYKWRWQELWTKLCFKKWHFKMKIISDVSVSSSVSPSSFKIDIEHFHMQSVIFRFSRRSEDALWLNLSWTWRIRAWSRPVSCGRATFLCPNSVLERPAARPPLSAAVSPPVHSC